MESECKLNGSNETPRALAFNQYTNPNSQRILTSVISVALGPQGLEWQNSAFPTHPLYSHGLSSVCVHKARDLSRYPNSYKAIIFFRSGSHIYDLI